MKTEEEVKDKIRELILSRENYVLRSSAYKSINKHIDILIWVLE